VDQVPPPPGLNASAPPKAWLDVALHGGHVVARAAWWTGHAGASPEVLDVFDIAEHPKGVGIGARLLGTAMSEIIPAGSRAPEYSHFVPPDWRDRIASRRAVQEPMAAIEQTGGRFFVERLRLEWRPGTPIPEPTGRLAFRPVEEHTQLVTLMAAILDGTLDAHGRADLATMSPEEAAVGQYEDELMSYESPRDWCASRNDQAAYPSASSFQRTTATTRSSPTSASSPHIGATAMSTKFSRRARAYAGQDVPRNRASTDVGNAPMAEAFWRAG
jgi:hypothetical protein